MGGLLNELRITLRTLARARGFTVVVVVTLSLALAVATSVMAIVNAYLVRSLPYPHASRLYHVLYAERGESPPEGLEAIDWQAVSDVVEHPIAWDLDVFYLLGGDHPERSPGAWVTPGFMQGLGIRPAIGRAFTPEEFVPGGPQVALISHELWRGRFGGDSAILGRRIRAYVSDRPRDPEIFTIVGVLPADFWHLNPYTQLLTPLRAASYPYIVRLREGVPPEMAERRIAALVRESLTTLPAGWKVEMRSSHDQYTREMRPLLGAISAAVGLVLLIACANVALLVLLRGIRRQKELAVRLALGATKARIARTLLMESVLLCAAAATSGAVVARLLLRWLGPTVEQQLGRRVPGGVEALSMDAGVAGAMVLLTAIISLVLSLAPLAVMARRSLYAALRRGKQGGADGTRGRRIRFALITLEVAGSVALLAACGLMVRTVVGMLQVELGIRSEGVSVASLAMREQSYPDVRSRVAFYERLLASLREGQGASTAVALGSPPPLVVYNPQPVRPEETGAVHRAAVLFITADYLSTLGIPLRQGRTFAPQDRGASDPVAMVSETAARRFWPNGNAIGQRIGVVQERVDGEDTLTVVRTVVGVVGDVRQSPTDSTLTDVYVPLLQAPGRFAAITMRTSRPLPQWVADLQRAVSAIDPEVSLGTSQVLDDTVDEQMARPRFLASLFAGFGVFASVLGVMGLYAVIAYAVQQREHEVAVRMAVGADGPSIVRLFMRDGSLVLVVGIVAGILGAVAIGRVLEAQLFGVHPVDALTLVTASIALGAACLAAMWLPARRASRTDPVIALKAE
ncbi:MAG TPA: ADOP family duplicated permease [Gemmatimonadaceae bacterium]|nr:ADOP family duplicated permease [Gemmatimonadaceae bacterium]